MVYCYLLFGVDTLLGITLSCKMLMKEVLASDSEIFMDKNSCIDELLYIVREISAQMNDYFVDSNDLLIVVVR